MAKRELDSGTLSAEECRSNQRYDEANYSPGEKRQFLDKDGKTKICRRVISPYVIGLPHDQPVAAAVVCGAGLPLPRTCDVHHEIRPRGSVPVVRCPQDLGAVLHSNMTYPRFAEPISGWQGRDFAHLERYEEKTDSIWRSCAAIACR